MCVKSQLEGFRRTVLDWIVSGLVPRTNKLHDKFIAIIAMQTKGMETYLDESGITQEDHCVMAGFVGGYGQWRSLAKAWDGVVEELPKMDFHAKTFFGRDENGKRVGPYKDWTDEKADNFLESLIDAIFSVNLHPIGGVVDYAAFNCRTLDERIFLTGGVTNREKWLTSGSPEKPYYLAFQHCMTDAIGYANHNGIKVNFFCDSQKQLAPYAHELYEKYKRLHPLRVIHCGALTYVDRLDVRVVQAADLLSYVTYRHKSNPTEETDYTLNRLLEKENELRFYSHEGIEHALHNYAAPKLTMGEMNPQAAERERKRRLRLGLPPTNDIGV